MFTAPHGSQGSGCTLSIAPGAFEDENRAFQPRVVGPLGRSGWNSWGFTQGSCRLSLAWLGGQAHPGCEPQWGAPAGPWVGTLYHLCVYTLKLPTAEHPLQREGPQAR